MSTAVVHEKKSVFATIAVGFSFFMVSMFIFFAFVFGLIGFFWGMLKG